MHSGIYRFTNVWLAADSSEENAMSKPGTNPKFNSAVAIVYRSKSDTTDNGKGDYNEFIPTSDPIEEEMGLFVRNLWFLLFYSSNLS